MFFRSARRRTTPGDARRWVDATQGTRRRGDRVADEEEDEALSATAASAPARFDFQPPRFSANITI